MATKLLPWSTSEKKCANSDSGSIVPPDLEETMNRVRCRSTAPSIARILAASVESRTCSRGPTVASRERAAQDLRGERGAAHPQQHDVLQFVVVRLGGEQLERAQLREHPLGDRQPAEPVGQLRRARRTPQRRVPAAQPLAHLRLSCERQTVLRLRSQRSREVGLDGQGAVAHATIVVAAAALL